MYVKEKRKKKGKSSGGTRKYGRSRRKSAARLNPLSRYIRGKITWEKYYSLVGGAR